MHGAKKCRGMDDLGALLMLKDNLEDDLANDIRCPVMI